MKEPLMKAKVDTNVCAGTRRCEEHCPQVFKVVNDVSTVRVDVVPPEAEDACRKALEDCPTGAISVEE